MILAGQRKIEKELQALRQTQKFADKSFLNLKEASKITGIGYQTIRQWCYAGKITYQQERPGATILVSRDVLEKFILENGTQDITINTRKSPPEGKSIPINNF